MIRRKKSPWAASIDELPESEQAGAFAAIYLLKVAGRILNKQKVPPIKKSEDFEALVARVAGPSLGKADEQEARALFDVAHCLRDARTVLAGSRLVYGPYGDLFYRVLDE